MNCQFLEPVYWDKDTMTLVPTDSQTTKTMIWNFSKITCDEGSTTEKIVNTTTGAEFYLEKTLDYGNILILSFLLLFFIFGAVKFLVDLLIPHRVNLKS